MTHEEIVKWFRRFRFDPEFRDAGGSQTVPIKQFCEFACINRSHFYRVIRGEDALTDNVRLRLTAAIEAVQDGLRWKREHNRMLMVNPKKFQSLPRYERLRRAEDRV